MFGLSVALLVAHTLLRFGAYARFAGKQTTIGIPHMQQQADCSRIARLVCAAWLLLLAGGCSSPSAATLTAPAPTALAPIAIAHPTNAPIAKRRPTARPTTAPTAPPPPTATTSPTQAPTATPPPPPTPTPGATACGETRGRIVPLSITSRALGKDQRYRVYLPPCYEQQTHRRYPVIYLLHGAGHDDGYWDDVGVDEAADPLIAAGAIPPVLIVLPDGNRTFGTTRGDPPPFGAFLLRELIPHIDARYRTLADREHRAIGGISLGGAWALLLAARYPAAFGAVGGHSPAIGPLNGINPAPRAFADGNVRVYLDVGDRDSLKAPTARLDAALTALGWPHEFHVYPGRHVEAYWTSHLEEYLRFYAALWGGR